MRPRAANSRPYGVFLQNRSKRVRFSILLWEGQPDFQIAVLIDGRDPSAHPLGERLGDREPQASAALRRFHRIIPVKETADGDGRQMLSGIAEGDDSLLGHGHGEVAVAILQGVGEDVVEDPGKRLGIQGAHHWPVWER